MLFDLYLDPVERVNLIKDGRYKKVYNFLSDKLQSWMESTNDPLLLGGRVQKPEGAVVNKLSNIEPNNEDFK